MKIYPDERTFCLLVSEIQSIRAMKSILLNEQVAVAEIITFATESVRKRPIFSVKQNPSQ